jgi:hypothetical protein
MKVDQHSHNLKLAHSWIMVLATPARQARPTATVHQHHHPNTSPNQLFEPISPFQEFTGHRLHYNNSNNNNNNKYHKQQQPRRCIAGDQLAALKAKNLFQQAALQDNVVAPLSVERNHPDPDAPQHRHTHAGGIPLEIVTVTDQLPSVPGMIHVSQKDILHDDDDNDFSEVSFEDTPDQQYRLGQLDPFGLNDSNAALFPPLSKHHTQHDTTWGITTMRFEGEDNDDDDDYDNDDDVGIDLDDDDTMSDIDCPSDEDNSEDHRRAPPNLMCADATHALFRQNMNCSGLQFWTKGAVHQRNLSRKTTITAATANSSKYTASTANTRAPVRPLAATRDEENTHERIENGSSRDTVLEVPWASYEDFHFSRTGNRSYASRVPSRVQLV